MKGFLDVFGAFLSQNGMERVSGSSVFYLVRFYYVNASFLHMVSLFFNEIMY